MSARKIVLVLLALVIAGGTVQFTRVLLNRSRPAPAVTQAAPEAPKGPRVLVAAADLPAGTLIQPSHLRWRAWPDESGLDTVYAVQGKRTLEDFAGAVVRQGIRVGEPVADSRVVKPGERGFLAAVLTPGMRAESIAVTGVTGVAGFLMPGDRVDVILTHALGRSEETEKERHVSETVLTGVRVLALDQRLNDQKPEAKLAQLATLEVTPRQAEVLALTAQMGGLTLSLHGVSAPRENAQVAAADGGGGAGGGAVGGNVQVAARSITWDNDVSLALTGGNTVVTPARPAESTPSESGAMMVKVQVVRGSAATEVTFPQR